jgi:hypothetical protein
MRRLLILAIALSATTASPSLRSGQASAQSGGVRLGPQFVSYTLSDPTNVTISEMAIPVFAFVPLSRGLTLDVGTAFATANVKSTVNGQAQQSKISGLTDTQIRATMNMGSDLVLFTAGLNIPTGKSTADTSEQMAAALIGNDFLVFPISSMGSGFGGTGGIALAVPAGQWNIGAGFSLRTSMPFDPYMDNAGNKLRYTPGTEMRARFGVDHPFGTGRASVGVTFSRFGDDKFESSIYNTGNRLLTQGLLSNSIWGGDYVLSAWNLFRSSGTLADGSPTGTESITDITGAYGINLVGGRIEPGVSVRTWMQEDFPVSFQSTVSLRYEKDMGRMAIAPSGGFTFGSIGASATESAGLTGFRAQLTIRVQ